MVFRPDERVVIAIDGPNFYATCKALGIEVDFRLLLEDFRSRCRLLRAFYYTALLDEGEVSTIRPLVDWLDYNGYAVVTKTAKEFIDSEGRRTIKGSMDIELAVDAMELAGHYDHFALFSGDGEFTSLVAALQRLGKRVTVASTLATPRPMVSDDLRRQADDFFEVAEIAKRAGRVQVSTTRRAPAAKPGKGSI